MFKWLNNQGVESTKGFVVQSVDRFTIEYIEGSKLISLYVERGFLPDGKVCIYITPDAFQKWDDGILISELKQTELLKNFKEAMEFQKIVVLIN
jgi:hypothetical protein